jgi:hypothetical protein
MSEAISELKTGQNEILEGLAKVFDGARNEAVKFPGGHELKHGEVWGALAGTAIVGAGLLLGLDPTKTELGHFIKFTEFQVGNYPSVLEFARDVLQDNSKATAFSDGGGAIYGVWHDGPAHRYEETLRGVLGLDNPTLNNLTTELAKMEMHRQFRNITSLALVGTGFISGVLAVTAGKAKERVVWSDTIGPLLAKGIRAMNNVSEA